VGEAGGLTIDDPDPGTPRSARGKLLDPAVVQQGTRRDGVLGKHLGHVAAADEGGGQHAFEHVTVDEGSVGHGGIVIVVPADPSQPETVTTAGHGPHAGLSAQLELTVGPEDTAEHFRSGDVPVLATPRLIALCEEATCRATDGHLNETQSSVATRVQFDHLAPVAVGSVVLAEATLVKVEGRRLIFTVSAARLEGDGGGLVGAGRVTRVVVDRSTFLAKAGAAGPS
jgi:predicted thioesterase